MKEEMKKGNRKRPCELTVERTLITASLRAQDALWGVDVTHEGKHAGNLGA
jgi:hypothetical protein